MVGGDIPYGSGIVFVRVARFPLAVQFRMQLWPAAIYFVLLKDNVSNSLSTLQRIFYTGEKWELPEMEDFCRISVLG